MESSGEQIYHIDVFMFNFKDAIEYNAFIIIIIIIIGPKTT